MNIEEDTEPQRRYSQRDRIQSELGAASSQQQHETKQKSDRKNKREKETTKMATERKEEGESTKTTNAEIAVPRSGENRDELLNGDYEDEGEIEPDIEQSTIEDDMIDSVSDILDQPEFGIDLTDADEDARPSVGGSTTDDMPMETDAEKTLELHNASGMKTKASPTPPAIIDVDDEDHDEKSEDDDNNTPNNINNNNTYEETPAGFPSGEILHNNLML